MENTLDSYMQNYGSRLQSAMQPQGAPPMGAEDPSAIPGDGFGMESQQPGGTTVETLWDKDEHDAKKTTADLEAALKKGNETIDSAYDQMLKQLGQRPKAGLSKQQKAMQLTRFGLMLMANSGKTANIGAAAGEAGLKIGEESAAMATKDQSQFDTKVSAIEGARAKAKGDFAATAAGENVKSLFAKKTNETRARRTVTSNDGLYSEDPTTGELSRMKDPETGKPLMPNERDVQGKDFEWTQRYNKYVDVYGKGPDGKPLTGSALQKVQQDAYDAASDPRGTTMSEIELRLQAEKSADQFIQSNSDAYRGMTPQAIEVERNKIADARLQRLRRGRGARKVVRTGKQNGRNVNLYDDGSTEFADGE